MRLHSSPHAGLVASLTVSMFLMSGILADASMLQITSPEFSNGATIPTQFTCSGANKPPPLAWSDMPQGTKSLALLLEDPDAPGGTFVHWVVYDIPPNLSGSKLGAVGGKQGVNGAGEVAYMGPCPPPGRPHHYYFRLFALDANPNVGARPDAQALRDGVKGHVMDSAELVGIFGR
jgi:Raf kinase inhibitor-like YbhB/YbcL family protein